MIDRTLKLLLTGCWENTVSASGQKTFIVRSCEEDEEELTGPCMHSVMDHRTCLVTIPEELDLSGIDQTLGGSVRSLPPERPVSR